MAWTERPESAAEAAAAVGAARRAELPVVVRGSGSRAGWLPGWAEAHVCIETTGLVAPPDIWPENLSARFGAGTPLAEVQRALAAADLCCPIEHDEAPGATLGGVLAAGATGPAGASLRQIRDWVLGLTIVTAEGEVLETGAAVMKNVAGYNLPRLHIGARGTLGIITGVTLRLLPRPAARLTVRATADADVTHRALQAVAAAGLTPTAACWLAGRLLLRFDGRADVAGAEAETARAALAEAGAGAPAVLAAEEAAPDWQERAGLHRRWIQAAGADLVRVRIALPRTEICTLPRRVAEALGDLPHTLALEPWLGLGQVWYGAGVAPGGGETAAPGAARAPAGTAAALAALRQDLQAAGGLLWVEAAPAAVLQQLPARAPSEQDGLEAALREALAPGRCFNPHL